MWKRISVINVIISWNRQKTNNLLTFVNVGSIKQFKLLFWGWIVICDLYLFDFIVLLNPDFNYSKIFILFSFDKLTTGRCNFVSLILNSDPIGATVAGLLFCAALTVISTQTQFLHQVKINSTSQLISGINYLNILKFT